MATRHKIKACDKCKNQRCVVCGNPAPAPYRVGRRYCSEECAVKARLRRKSLRYERRTPADEMIFELMIKTYNEAKRKQNET